MSESDGAAVDVDLVEVEAEFAGDGDGGDGEGFVDLVEIDFVLAPSGFLPELANGVHRGHHDPRRIQSAGGLGDNAGERLLAKLLRHARAGDDQGRRAVVHAGCVAGGHGAVLLERGFELAQDFDGRVLARAFVLLEQDHLALLLAGNFDGNDLVLEAALLDRRDGLAMRVDGVLVLLLARDLVFVGDVLAGVAHVIVVVDVPEAVLDHRVDERAVAEAVALACVKQQVGRVGHGLHAAGDDDLAVVGEDGLRRQADRFQSRTADFVDGHGADRRRNSRAQCGLTRGVLSQTRAHHVAHDDFIHRRRVHTRAPHRFLHRNRAQLGRGDIGQRALKFSDRRAHAGNNYDIVGRRHKSAPD